MCACARASSADGQSRSGGCIEGPVPCRLTDTVAPCLGYGIRIDGRMSLAYRERD